MEQYRSSSSRNSGRYRRKKSSGSVPTILFYILPFLLFNGILFYCVTTKPTATLTLEDTTDYLTTSATLKIGSWFPTKSVSINLDGVELEPEKGKKRTYTVSISKNGVLEAVVTNINGMSVSQFEHVNILDENPPAFENERIQDGIVTVSVTDSQSGVDFDSVYALNAANEQLIPLEVDRSTNTVSYEMESSGLFIFAKDKAGNEAKATFTSRREGELEMNDLSVPAAGGEGAAEGGNAADPSAAAGSEAGTEASTSAASTTAGGSDVQITIN